MANLKAVAPTAKPIAINSYYAQVFALTQKDTSTQAGTTNLTNPVMPTLSPYMIWAPYALFFILFVSAFAILVGTKIHDWKRTTGALILALMLAGIPFVIKSIQNNGVTTQFRAGPEERPRHIEIIRQSNSSAIVNWTTDAQVTGAVKYGLKPLNDATARVIVADNDQKTQTHSAKIGKLEPGKIYEVEVYSGAHWYNDGGIPIKFTVSGK